MFLPQSERPSFAPIQYKWQVYNFGLLPLRGLKLIHPFVCWSYTLGSVLLYFTTENNHCSTSSCICLFIKWKILYLHIKFLTANIQCIWLWRLLNFNSVWIL
jgi:hypothetical protein